MNSNRLARLTDLPLNYREDQRANLNPQLRQLNLRLGLRSALDFLLNPPAALLVGGAVGLLYKRRYGLASLLVVGLTLQRLLAQTGGSAKDREREARARRGMEFERRTLKAQRGDYGKLDLIAFK